MKMYKSNEIKQLQSISKLNNKYENIFICTASYEERCLGSVNLFSKDIKFKLIYIIKYDTKENDENYHILKNKLKKYGKIHSILIDPMFPIFQYKDIVKNIIDNVNNIQQLNIYIDISTFMKWHLLIFLKILKERDLLNKIIFVYTEPIDYEINLFQPLSFGLRDIFPVPFFYGDFDFSKENLLIIFIGYEGNRALSLFEKIEPEECLLLLADPPYWPEWKGRAEDMNKSLIHLLGDKKIIKIDSRNPIKVCEQLNSILTHNSYNKYNHLISPLGTKPQALGLFYYISKYNPKNTILTYSAPLRYNTLFYSKGIGRTWHLPTY